jgi:hypothetical protein
MENTETAVALQNTCNSGLKAPLAREPAGKNPADWGRITIPLFPVSDNDFAGS